MKRHIIILITTVLLPLAMWSQSTPVMGTLLLNGKEIAAEYTISGNKASLGSGRNACIPHYSKGRVIVPASITINGRDYAVKEVSAMAFRFCGEVTFIHLPEGITRIGDFAFKGCKGLVDVSLPSTLESIGTGAFIGLPSLRAVYCQALVPPRWEYNDVFCRHEGGIGSTKTYTDTQVTLYVPIDKINDYRNSAFSDSNLGWTTPDGWKYFSIVKGTNDYETEWGIGISTPLALNNFRTRVNNGESFNGKTVKIEADIDMLNEEWDSGIGGRYNYFRGTLDGQQHTISNLRINVPDKNSSITRLGLFSYIVYSTITNLRLDNFYVISQSKAPDAGVLAGVILTSTISNCYVSNSYVITGANAGGLVGSSSVTSINKCVVEATVAVHTPSEESFDDGNGVGGLVGFSNDVTIRNCAVIDGKNPTGNYNYCVKGPFVGQGEADVDYCYTDAQQFDKFKPSEQNRYVHGEHVVVYGQEVYIALAERKMPLNTGLIKNFLTLVPFLGLDDWVYCVGKYPLPDCFEDLYDVQVNNFSLRPATLTTPRPNALTLTETLTYDDWTSGNYRNASFKTSSLWIDDNLNYTDREQIPIGTATIECINGVRYERTLTAPENGTQAVEYPVYQTDEDGMIVLDENGQRIPTGETQEVEETVYKPTAYCFFLPYPMTFSNGIHLYQPTEVKSINDTEAQVTFVENSDKHADAWTPYYAIVDGPSVSLGTEEHVVINPVENNAVNAGNGYFFDGTVGETDRSLKDSYLLQSDKTWKKIGDKIQPFQAYFYSTGESQADIITTFATLLLKNDADNSVVIEDNDGTTTNVTLDGRTLYKGDTWNTLCLPFDVSDFTGTPLEGATVKTLESASFDNATGTLTLNFSEENLSAIEAGEPYIVKWSGGEDIANPVFRDVTISSAVNDVTTDAVAFCGITSPLSIVGEEKTMLYLGGDNKLYYPNDAMTIGAFRAYFILKNGITAGDPVSMSGVRSFILNFDGGATLIKALTTDSNSGPWYDLQGRRLSTPSSKGVYIRDGKKFVIK